MNPSFPTSYELNELNEKSLFMGQTERNNLRNKYEISHSFVLAESFDAMPLHLYDTVEAFTAPTLEPDYLDHATCLHCDDSGKVEAINQFNQDVLAPCPFCSKKDIAKPKFNMPAIYLHLYSKMPKDKLTIWEKKHRDSLLEAA